MQLLRRDVTGSPPRAAIAGVELKRRLRRDKRPAAWHNVRDSRLQSSTMSKKTTAPPGNAKEEPFVLHGAALCGARAAARSRPRLAIPPRQQRRGPRRGRKWRRRGRGRALGAPDGETRPGGGTSISRSARKTRPLRSSSSAISSVPTVGTRRRTSSASPTALATGSGSSSRICRSTRRATMPWPSSSIPRRAGLPSWRAALVGSEKSSSGRPTTRSTGRATSRSRSSRPRQRRRARTSRSSGAASRPGEALEEVKADVAEATELRVTGTPTFFINGRQVADYRDGALEKIVEHILAGDAGM